MNIGADWELNSEFLKEGFVVIKNAFPASQIDSIVAELEKIKNSKIAPFYYSQATHRYKKISIDANGFIDESMLGFARNKFLGKLSLLSSRLLLSSEMENYLRKIFPYYSKFVQQNNMLFDKSMETVDHIDSWYLDTHPKGALVGAWIALEDIHPHSGPFRVYPGSHKIVEAYKIQELAHDDFIKIIQQVKQDFPCRELILKKGDLVVWNSCTIHGASKVKDNSFSRKSLTSHYFPLNASLQTKFTSTPKSISFRIFKSLMRAPNRSRGNAIYQLNTPLARALENLKYSLLQLGSFVTGKNTLGAISNDMRSNSY
ncbi:phytanoyl-CoA dioxygenase family protein [Synechococcus sp. M16.1]|uniref:phytanoyl-CoA dioxygenase family protein n=1 Tax=Synechococcus sp. M16.1 TaxID=1442553 RepID=UPI001648E50F|nr:phytanoyl-CoA dioxygenase family protein [Synechococcus sp. M16.1]